MANTKLNLVLFCIETSFMKSGFHINTFTSFSWAYVVDAHNKAARMAGVRRAICYNIVSILPLDAHLLSAR
jgi:hypothetical protein